MPFKGRSIEDTHTSVKRKELRSDARKVTGINSLWWCAQSMCLYMFGLLSTACWINDALLDWSPDDQVWGWSIWSMEILDQDKAHINDDVLRDMLYMAILDLDAETVWAEALNLCQSTCLMSVRATLARLLITTSGKWLYMVHVSLIQATNQPLG